MPYHQGGETTRNIDGVVYYISYDKAADDIVVVDRKLGVRYPAGKALPDRAPAPACHQVLPR